MDSGNTPEIKEEVAQPDETVVVDSEATKATPQAEATEETELYIEEEADQEQAKHGMSQSQSYAAFQKEKEKRKKKQLEIDEGKTERAAMQATIDKLQETVGKITKGAVPTLESCDFDESQYATKMQEYYSTPGKPAKQEAATPQAQNNVQNDEAEYSLYQQEQALTKELPDYEEAKASFMNTVKSKYGVKDPSATVAMIADISKQTNVDAAKVIYAMNKIPALIGELNSCNNPFAMAKVLEKAASKIKSRVKVPITTQPEPEINNTGPIDNSSGTVAKLYKAWQENSSLDNYKRYMKAKNS